MPMTERLQVLVTPEQRRRLERVARIEGRSVGAVIRDAIERAIPAPRGSSSDPLEEMFALDLPVGDWADLKEEIIRAAAS